MTKKIISKIKLIMNTKCFRQCLSTARHCSPGSEQGACTLRPAHVICHTTPRKAVESPKLGLQLWHIIACGVCPCLGGSLLLQKQGGLAVGNRGLQCSLSSFPSVSVSNQHVLGCYCVRTSELRNRPFEFLTGFMKHG